MKEIIKLENLSYVYENGQDKEADSPALSSVNLTIYEGEYVAVLGHNGSGKSTLAKLCNLILSPTRGKLIIDGKDVTDHNFTEEDLFDVRRKVGMVFQNPDNQLVASLVEEDVAFGPENLGLSYDEMHKRVDEALETVHMTEYRNHSAHKLSGGQKQRVAIAGVLAMKPKCIIFDESTAMLDPIGRKEVLHTMENLNRESGITILHITHYMEEAARADRILIISDGKLVMDGTPVQIFSNPEKLWNLGLDVPQTEELVTKLRKKGFQIEDGKLDVKETAKAILDCIS